MTTWNDDIDRLAREQITHGDEKIDAFRKGFHAASTKNAQALNVNWFPFPMNVYIRNKAELIDFMEKARELLEKLP
jgi:hypothetical protein